MASNDSYFIEILNNANVNLHRYGNLVIYILGMVGDLLSAFVFFQRSWRKNVCVFYFLIGLFLNSLYLHSTILGTALITGFNINAQNSSVILCKLYYYTVYLSATLFPTVLILASIDRLLISSQNVDTRLYSSKRLAYFSVSLSTFFWVVFNFHVLIKTNLQQLGPSSFGCYYDLSILYIEFISYSLVIFNCLFCFLMIILSIFAFKNVRGIRVIPRQRQTQIRSMTKKDFQLLRCLFVQDIVYISLSFVPSIYSVYSTATMNQRRTPLEQAINDFIENFLYFIFYTFHCVSCFIFLTVSKAFRRELKRKIYKMCGKDLISIREEDNGPTNVRSNNVELNFVSTIVLPA
jgi:hypothetical protein